MKIFSLVVTGIIFLSVGVQCNSYGGGEDTQTGKPTQNSQQAQISSLPQYESGGTELENLWWLKNNPFQKPANHPGVERGEGQTNPSQNPSYNPGAYPNTQNRKPNSVQEQVPGGWNNPTQFVKPSEENPDCLLRNKADCHPAAPIANTVAPVPQNLNIVVPETAYRPPKYDVPNESPKPVPQARGPTPPPLPYQSNQKPSSTGQYDPKPYVQYQPANPNIHHQAKPLSFNQNKEYSPANNNFEELPPSPLCPAAMNCTKENYCNAKGVIVEQPIALSPAEKIYRVALSSCSFPTSGEIGVCCRDPNYKDPWPDMGVGHEHHPKDSSGGHGHNDGQYRPVQQQYNSGQYQPSGNNNKQYNPTQHQSSGFPTNPYQQTQVTKDIPASPSQKGGGYTSGDGCRPSY